MKALPLCAFCLLLATCITPYDPGITGNIPKLVVYGEITDQPGPHTIWLSNSSAYVNKSENNVQYISNADLKIEDSDGVFTNLNAGKNGIYETPKTFAGKVGKKYSLHISLPNGKKYQSQFEEMRSVAPIDTIVGEYRTLRTGPRGEFDIMIEFKDPTTKGDYYWYKWEHFSLADLCYDKIDLELQIRYTADCCEPCWQVERCPSCINVLSDDYVNGASIKVPITAIPYDAKTSYFLAVEQRSLTESAYKFWRTAMTQVNNSGGIFDSPPVTIHGNLYGITDPEEQVLGLFAVSAVAAKQIHFKRNTVIAPPYEKIVPAWPIVELPCVPCANNAYRTSNKPQGWGDIIVVE